MTHSVDISQPLSSAILAIAVWTHEQCIRSDRDGGCTWAQEHGFPLIKATLATAPAECLICQ